MQSLAVDKAFFKVVLGVDLIHDHKKQIVWKHGPS